jgi:hypothetical protein
LLGAEAFFRSLLYIPPVAGMLSWRLAIGFPARVALTVTFQVPPLCRLIVAA